MTALKLLAFVLVILPLSAYAQGTAQSGSANRNRVNGATGGAITGATPYRGPVATQPSNNPFQNPISQGTPPAASSTGSQNIGRTNR